MCPFVRACDGTKHLRVNTRAGQGAHRPVVTIRRLLFEACPIDSTPIEPRRGAGLEPAHRQIGAPQLLGELVCCALTYPAPLEPFLPPVENTTKKSPSAKDDGGRGKLCTIRERETRNGAARKQQGRHLSSDHGQQCLFGDDGLDLGAEQRAVRLHTWPPDRAALRSIEHPIVDCCRIGRSRDHAIERIDFPDQMALAQSTDRRIAAHRADLVGIEAHQPRSRTHPGSCAGRLHSGVAAADNKDIEFVHQTGPLTGAASRVKKPCFT